jgi:hypothetical protein
MTYPGIKDARQRADLLAFLKDATQPGRVPKTAQGGNQMGGMMMGGGAVPNLKKLDPQDRVQAITHCGDTYKVSTADGKIRDFWERRVLRPEGRLLFVEHGLAPDRGVAWWQHRLTPCWKCFGGGCHLNRKIDDLIKAAGFHIEELDTGYMQGRNPFAFMYEGVARPTNGTCVCEPGRSIHPRGIGT